MRGRRAGARPPVRGLPRAKLHRPSRFAGRLRRTRRQTARRPATRRRTPPEGRRPAAQGACGRRTRPSRSKRPRLAAARSEAVALAPRRRAQRQRQRSRERRREAARREDHGAASPASSEAASASRTPPRRRTSASVSWRGSNRMPDRPRIARLSSHRRRAERLEPGEPVVEPLDDQRLEGGVAARALGAEVARATGGARRRRSRAASTRRGGRPSRQTDVRAELARAGGGAQARPCRRRRREPQLSEKRRLVLDVLELTPSGPQTNTAYVFGRVDDVATSAPRSRAVARALRPRRPARRGGSAAVGRPPGVAVDELEERARRPRRVHAVDRRGAAKPSSCHAAAVAAGSLERRATWSRSYSTSVSPRRAGP